MKKNLYITFYALASLGGLAFFITLFTLLSLLFFGNNLPDCRWLADYEPITINRFYSEDFELIGESSGEKRIFVSIKNIPDSVIQAFLAAEDKNFYENTGVDTVGIVRSVLLNMRNSFSGKRMVGASTITQQMIRNFVLSRERTISRKMKEIILAHKVTKFLTKDKILELYLNQIYLGDSAYGIGYASYRYFNKSIEDVTLEEAALLAALPKAPSKLNPRKNPDAAKQRRDWVLGRMLEDNFISETDMAIAKSRPINLAELSNIISSNKQEYIYYHLDEIQKAVDKTVDSVNKEKGGLSVYSTMNLKLQRRLVESLRSSLEEYDRRHEWRGPEERIPLDISNQERFSILRSINLKNNMSFAGELAVVTGISMDKNEASLLFSDGLTRILNVSQIPWGQTVDPYNNELIHIKNKKISDYFDLGDVIRVRRKNEKLYINQIPAVNGAAVAIEASTGRVLALVGGYSGDTGSFNRATMANRQTGSVFKPFVYLAALEAGLSPTTIVMDDEISIDQGKKKPFWQPQNFGGSYYGPVTIRKGFELSRNLVTVRIASFIGMNKISEIAERFGLKNSFQGYSAVLGAGESILLDMTSAYASIANGGKRVIPKFFDNIQNYDGINLLQSDFACDKTYLDQNSYDFSLLEPLLPNCFDKGEKRIADEIKVAQLSSMLEGAAIRGTAKLARIPGVSIAGKTGTTNNNTDGWFIGYAGDLAVGVYVGFDLPKDMGSKEVGARTALPVFRKFISTCAKEEIVHKKRPIPVGARIIKSDWTTGIPADLLQYSSGELIDEIVKIGLENEISSLIESTHYYDAENNKWIIKEQDFLGSLIDSVIRKDIYDKDNE